MKRFYNGGKPSPKDPPMPLDWSPFVEFVRSQDDLGGLRLVDTSAESCCRLVCEAIDALGVPLSQEMATHLFIGLAMDTGWFHHANTSAATFALADRLTRAGADPNALYDEL